MAQAVWKLKKSNRDENDIILGFDFEIEWTCDVGAESGLERTTVLSRSSVFDFSYTLGPGRTMR